MLLGSLSPVSGNIFFLGFQVRTDQTISWHLVLFAVLYHAGEHSKQGSIVTKDKAIAAEC